MSEHILTIELKALGYHEIISTCEKFYTLTGCKFSVRFNGSKGYLDSIDFQIEGAKTFNIAMRGQEKIFFFRTNSGEFYIEETK